MLTYDRKAHKFYINDKLARTTDGRCIDCTQPTTIIKGDGLAFRVGCACDDGISLRDVPTVQVRAQVIGRIAPRLEE